jgi:hypothetical protein
MLNTLLNAFSNDELMSPKGKDFIHLKEHAEFRLIIGGWGKYLRSNPRIIICELIPEDIQGILEEQQELAQSLLSHSEFENQARYNQLLASIKKLVPSIQRATGDSEKQDTIITNSTNFSMTGRLDGQFAGFYNSLSLTAAGTFVNYKHFYRQVTKSSDKSLHRFVENLTINATVTDIEIYIEAISSHWSKWMKRTVSMSDKGSSKVRKNANFAYLKMLDELLKKLKNLKIMIEADKNIHAKKVYKWSKFKENELPILSDYFKKNGREIEFNNSNGSFTTNFKESTSKIILEFPASSTVYFDISKNNIGGLPLKLIKL